MNSSLIDLIDAEIRGGLKNEADRLDRARQNWEFDQGDFSRFPYRQTDSPFGRSRFVRTATVMSRVVDVLTRNLYREGPTRTLDGADAASEWLSATYRANSIDALWQTADRDATIGQVAAFQVEGTLKPDKPIRIHLWDASQFAVWTSPDDATEPIAVATIDVADNARRLRVWTDELVRTYATDKLTLGQTAGGTAYRQVKEEDNGYGVLPFAFAHFKRPTKDFWSGGIGDLLFSVNDYINFRLTETGDNVRYLGRPIGVAEGCLPGWRPPTPVLPGDFIDLPAGFDAAGNGAIPNLRYLQADLGFVAAEWADLNSYLDLVMEMAGIPPGTVRLVSSATSGVQVIAEQAPLLDWAKGRQRPFGEYEGSLAKVALKVGGAWLNRPELVEAAKSAPLSLHWPNLYVDLPGPERDRADEWKLDMGIVGKLDLLMTREGLTRSAALERLKRIAEDNAELEAMGIDPRPAKAAGATAAPAL